MLEFRYVSKSIFRSKRLKAYIIYQPVLSILWVLMILVPLSNAAPWLISTLTCFPLLFSSTLLGQLGYSIGANNAAMFQTKPIKLINLLYAQYYMGIILSLCTAIVLSIVCLIYGLSIIQLLAFGIFSAGFVNLLSFKEFYKCKRFELFGSTYFNYQGANLFKLAKTIPYICLLLGILVLVLTPEIASVPCLVGTGFLGFLFKRHFLNMELQNYSIDRHSYYEHYLK